MEMPHDSKIKIPEIPVPPLATLLKLYWILMSYLSKVSGTREYEEGRDVQKAFGKNEKSIAIIATTIMCYCRRSLYSIS